MNELSVPNNNCIILGKFKNVKKILMSYMNDPKRKKDCKEVFFDERTRYNTVDMF